MKPANFPFVVSLASKRADKSLFCMGSLITPNLVLTAAHCLKDETYENVKVLIGPTDSRVSKSTYDVNWWRTFDQWIAKKDPSMFRLPFNDLAIIKVKLALYRESFSCIERVQMKLWWYIFFIS